ncbi:MAG: response regulator [Acidiferrobacterales bacterium]|nr:response regulator [Acidiferrobacterales bacterium]
MIYVDDQLDIRLVAEYALTNIGNFDLLMCESGEEALTKIEEYDPDLILLDVMMPGIDGPETLSRIRRIARFKTTPAIFITAKIFPSEVHDLMSYGAIDVIAKPFDPVTLSSRIQSVWDELEG